MRNAGQHNALLCGVRAASKELVITMDDDLQHPPEEIPNLVEALKSDVDVVYAIPGRCRTLPGGISSHGLQNAAWQGDAHQYHPGYQFLPLVPHLVAQSI